jgi:hypothetical protein
MFTDAEEKVITEFYSEGLSSHDVAKICKCTLQTVLHIVRRQGGAVRGKWDNHKIYFRNKDRECSLRQLYDLSAEDMDWMHKHQSGECLWCTAKLPTDSLKCVVDHIGGVETRGDRTKVRGLVCSVKCNYIAGIVENDYIQNKDFGLLASFVARVRHVMKFNKGSLSYVN